MKIEALGRATVGERVLMCLRPEDLVIRRRDERVGLESARNHLEGQVEDATPVGAQYRVRIACGPARGGVVALVTRQSFDDLALERGTPVVVTFKASAVHLIPR